MKRITVIEAKNKERKSGHYVVISEKREDDYFCLSYLANPSLYLRLRRKYPVIKLRTASPRKVRKALGVDDEYFVAYEKYSSRWRILELY